MNPSNMRSWSEEVERVPEPDPPPRHASVCYRHEQGEALFFRAMACPRCLCEALGGTWLDKNQPQQRRAYKPSPENMHKFEDAKKLRAQGLGYERIAKAVGVSTGLVWGWLNANGDRIARHRPRPPEPEPG